MAKTIQGRLSAEGLRVGIIASRWNDFVVSRLISGAEDALERLGATSDAITIIRVPGSFEIPMAARRAALSNKYDAIICLGVVIRGETSHNEYIAAEVFKGIAQASFETNLPITLGVVTVLADAADCRACLTVARATGSVGTPSDPSSPVARAVSATRPPSARRSTA